MKVGPDRYGWLYSAYSLPNLVMPFLSGYIIDKVGIRITLIFLAIIQIIGQGTITIGAYYENFNIMLLGRAIFGTANES